MIGYQPHRLYNAMFTAPANASDRNQPRNSSCWSRKIGESTPGNKNLEIRRLSKRILLPRSRCDRCQVLDNLPVTKVAERGAGLASP